MAEMILKRFSSLREFSKNCFCHFCKLIYNTIKFKKRLQQMVSPTIQIMNYQSFRYYHLCTVSF